MSLPTAPKDISENPTAGAVTDPVNKEDKDADVSRKIKFYGVIEAFRQGRMPTNAQIDQTLQYVTEHAPFDVSSLSSEGQKLVEDTREIIRTARTMVQEKNADELFQQFVWHTREVDLADAKKDPNEVAPVEKEKAQEDAQHAVRHLRTLLSLVMTNSEVRKLLSDFSVIGRDLLARGASKAADGLRPTDDQLAHVDESGPRDQFISKDGKVAGPNETPVLEARIPGTDVSVEQNPKDNVGSGTKVMSANGDTTTADKALDRAQNITDRKIDQLKEEADAVQDSTPEGKAKKQSIMDRIKSTRSGVADRIPEKHKDKAREQYERGKTFLTDEYFPTERRDQFIYRGKKVIMECQNHEDYKASMKWLLDYLDEYAGHARTVGEHGKDAHGTVTSNPAVRQSTREIRSLLERFANNQSMDGMLDAMNVLIDDANKDPELRKWFKEVNAYIRKVLLETGYVVEPACNNKARELRESGRHFYDDKYKSHFDTMFNSISSWFKAMGEDPLNKKFGDDWARLTKDLLFDADGALKFKREFWNDVAKIILPTMVDKIGYIPIPRIEYTDDALDLVVENLTLSGRNLFPNVVSLEAHNFVKFSPYASIKDKSHHEFTFTFSQMQADMRDVAFYFRKKSGIKMKDSGLADIVVGGEGITTTVHLVSAGKDKSSIFKVKKVTAKVASLKFAIRDSKHDLLYKTLKPLAMGLVKKQIQKAIEDGIRTGFEYADGQLVSVRDRMEEAKEVEGQTRVQVLKDTFAQKKDDASSKASTAASKASHFKVVSNKRNSLLANAGHPAGWVNRTSEKDQAALQGKEWRSEAFKIV